MCSIYYECVSAARYNVPIINIKEYRMSSNFCKLLMCNVEISYFCIYHKDNPALKITLYFVP